MIFETNHALGLKLENGAELLIHIGIDTVNIKEKVFESNVKVWNLVSVGQKFVRFDKEKIEKLGYDTAIMFIAINSQEYIIEEVDDKFTISRKEENA